MRITVNGGPEEFSGSIADLLEHRLGERRPQGVAVAVGDEVVRRDDWPDRPVRDGDEVEIVTAVQGG